MRETPARGPSIDLGEFERRLRGSERKPRVDDTLSELARLDHGAAGETTDPYSRILAEPREPRAPAPNLRGSYDAAPPVAAEPSYYEEPSIEQLLQRAYSHGPNEQEARPGQQPHAGGYETGDYEADANWNDDSQFLDYGQEDGEYEESYGGGWRSWLRPWHAVVAISLVAVLSIGFAFWHRSGSSASREIATIMAPEGPVKVKPTAEAEAEAAANASGAVVLDRKEQAPVQQVIANQEQAVDPGVTPKAAQLGDGPVNLPHEPAPAAAAPKRIKTVTVRPDGSPVEEGALPPAVAVASRPASEAQAAATAMGAATATPPSQAKPTATPPQIAKPKPAPKTAAVEESAPDADADQASAPSRGGYAVQFGAADSEADARALLKTVVSKYHAHLGGLKPTFKMATVNDKTVYRVRVAGVSKESANAICGKVKASGGACFVAGN
ncbi:MAG: SPOR domain-containing protein [Alphaproteobacteria bacterium]|nr:SPOR domain-containing protein [Alphaproteobacteria bacterium]